MTPCSIGPIAFSAGPYICSGIVISNKAEKLLMQTTNATGSFLVRESTGTHGNYSLSIRDAKKVRHHKIQKLDSGGYF